MNKENIEKLLESQSDDVKYCEELSKEIVSKNSKDLDCLMLDVKRDVVDFPNPALSTLQYYLLQLTNARYFMSSNIENFGFYDDIAKLTLQMKKINSYAESKENAIINNEKVTVNDHNNFAEKSALDESLISVIHSRSYRILREKLNSVDEMIKTLSKLISAYMNETNISKMVDNKE